MASALRTAVYPGDNGFEISWSSTIQPPDTRPAWATPLLQPGLKLFHWHGDNFDLPAGAQRFASTELYPNQAFTLNKNALALQFHLEVTVSGLERWYVRPHHRAPQERYFNPTTSRRLAAIWPSSTDRRSPILEPLARLHLVAAQIFVVQIFQPAAHLRFIFLI